MRQSACLVVNPITVDRYAFLFNCTAAVRSSDSMMALKCGFGPDAMSWTRPITVQPVVFCSYGWQCL